MDREFVREKLERSINRYNRCYMKSISDTFINMLYGAIDIAEDLGFEVIECGDGYIVK